MEKVWKRLIAVSLSLMLMFTMGLNVFAAENVEGIPSDDPAVILDEGEGAATDVEPADEAVVQEEPPGEVMAMEAGGDAVTGAVFDNSTTLADGDYSNAVCTVTKESDGTEATVLSLQKIIVTDAKAEGVFKVDKNTKTHVYIGSDSLEEDLPELVDPDTGTCGLNVYQVDTEDSLEVKIPVKLNSDMHVAVRTKMKTYKWVNYKYHIQISEPEWKPTQNQEKFSGIIYAKGMFSAAEKGTTLTVNPDATITIHATTKPMISNKYVKVALSSNEINAVNVEEIAAAIPVGTFTANDLYKNRKGEVVGQRPFYWSVFDYTVPLGMINNKINVWTYNTLKQTDQANSLYVEDLDNASWASWGTWTVIDTPELTKQIQSAYDNASSEEAKAAFEKALKNSAYNFSGDSVVIAAIPAKTYTGKAITPNVTVTAGETTLVKGTDYTVKYAGNINAGTAKVTVKGEGNYIGEKTATFKINPANQKLTMSSAQKTVKFKKLKKKAQKTSKVAVSGAKTKVTYAKVGGSKKLTINKTTGKITVKKKTKKGTYKIKVKATAAKSANYKAATVTKTIKVIVKK